MYVQAMRSIHVRASTMQALGKLDMRQILTAL